MLGNQFSCAKRFIYSEARLLERLLYAVTFERAEPATVGKIVSAYQNPDGGLGHALEPDVRCPESQPLFVEIGLSAMRNARWHDPQLSLSICSFLESVSDADGFVPILLPSALESPHAAHWTSAGETGINPTAGICGLLHYQGIEHPWLSRATNACCELLLRNPPREAHSLLCAAHLAEHLPDKQLAANLVDSIAVALPKARFFIPLPSVAGYGLTPLNFAPSPTSTLRQLFTQEQIEEHLASVVALQQADGGWPLSWNPPGPASRSEWRGKVTLEALSVLVAYGLITKP